MSKTPAGRPEETEYAAYYGKYVSLVAGDEILTALREQIAHTQKALAEIPEEKSLFRYLPDKWSIRELVGHLIDTERIMAYRALRFARNDKTPLEGFDQDPYVQNSGSDSFSLRDLSAEFAAVRDATLRMLENLTEDAWLRSGEASGNEVSVRALAYIIAGHELHHMKILSEKYLG